MPLFSFSLSRSLISRSISSREEGTLATENQKIFVAKLSNVGENILQLKLKELRETALAGDKETILKKLKEIVPSYNHG